MTGVGVNRNKIHVTVQAPCHPEPQAKDLIKAVPLRGEILRAKALRMKK